MAQQRKAPNGGKSPMNKPISTSAGKPAAKSAGRQSGSTRTTNASRPPNRPGSASGGARPPRKPGKSIVNQRQTPWTLIIVTTVLVLFAAAVVVFAVTRSGSSSKDSGNPYTHPEIAAAKAIKGVVYKAEPNHEHVAGTVKYDTSPPTGGNHNQYWADCTGTVYSKQIANENAVHMLEHGAVWITYNPKTATAADIAKLKTYVDGVDRMALSPYAGLKTPISLQAWGYQLFVDNANDARIAKFIDALRNNPTTRPENASCSDPDFVAAQSYPGHPFNG